MVGWHHWFNGHKLEQALGVGDGQGSLACYSSWGCRVGHNWATELNWYIYAHTYPSLSLSIDRYLGCSHVLAIEIILQQIWGCIYIFELEFSFSLDIYLGIGFTGSLAAKECTCNAGDLGLIPGLGRCPGGGRDNPLQYCCLENPRGQRSLAGCSQRGRTESDRTEWLSTYTQNCILK